MDEPLDALILGAGAAGIAAARTLLAAGWRIAVLEARLRPGGRAATDTTLGVPADLGAAWLHFAERNPLTAIARDGGFTVLRREPDWGARGRVGDAVPSAAEIARWQAAMRRYEAAIEAAARAGRDVALSAVLPQDAERARWDAVMTWAVGAGSDEISTLDYSRYADSEANWAVAEGLGAVVASSAAGLPVHYGAVVQLVDWRDPRAVTVATSAGTFQARAVLVTLPTSVLAAGTVRFDPPLPATHATALADLPLGVVNKVFFRFDEADLPPEPLFSVGSATTARTAHHQLRPAGQPLVMSFFGGELSRELEASGGLAEFARAELTRIFGAAFTTRIRGELATAWGADPFARGSYSVARPGRAHQRAVLAEPVSPSLAFAGEACSATQFGTVPGAWDSGLAAARQLLSGRG